MRDSREGERDPTKFEVLGSLRPKTAIALAAGMLALGMAALPSSASATIQLGAYTPGAPASADALADYAEMVGRQPDIVMSYRDFGLPLLYSNEVANLRATGQTPMVSWEPHEPLSEIASGAHDSYIRQEAQAAKAWGAPLMIRFGHEMNGDWYSWSGDPSDFVAAWRRVVSVFRAEGAANVTWVWSPNIQEGGKYPIAPYFPGDDWIDYAGLDGYNWGTAAAWGGKWESFETVFAPSYAIVTGLSTKPIIITETSSSEAGGGKADWIRDGFMAAIPRSFPRVAAVVWFNRTQEDDWRINSSQASLDAYRAVVACTTYGGTEPCAGSAGPGTAKPVKEEKPVVRALRVSEQVRKDVSGTVSYRLNRKARVKIRIKARGRRGRYTVTRHSRKGRNRVPLARLIRRHKLRPGRYAVVITARAERGQRSHPRKARFRVG